MRRLALIALLCLAAGCAGKTAMTAPLTVPKTYGLKIDNGAVGQAPANGKTLVAIYMVGSNLEDDVKPRNGTSDEEDNGGPVKTGAGSTNLRQLLAGYQGLSDAEKGNVDVVVGMGGSRKQGWQGIKYLDLPALVNDAKDDYFGNDGPFLYNDANADMSDPQVFQDFLTFVQKRSAGAGKVMLLLWDHGGAYMGVGPDSSHQDGTYQGQLWLYNIQAGLEATKFKGDLIGFDACMMANLEVASAVKDHFRYLVGSEETEPGHGWDYTYLTGTLGKQPTLSAVDLGRGLVDNYIESPLHQTSKGRTLSVTDLGQVAALNNRLDGLSSTFQGSLSKDYQPVLNSTGAAQHYGREGDAGTEFSLDLADFADRLKGSAQDAGGVASAVAATVVYSRESGEKPNSRGLSIYSLANTAFFDNGLYTNQVAPTAAWYTFVSDFIGKAKGATAAPTVSGETAVADAASLRSLMAFQAPALGTVPNGSFHMDIQATPGVSRVSAMHVIQPDPAKNRFMAVSSDRVDPDAGGGYTLPGWDGTAMHLADGKGGSVLVPTTFENTTATGTAVYAAPARVNGEEATVYIEWDKARNQAVSQWVTPFTPASGKQPVNASKLQNDLAAGDTVSFYDSYVDTDAGTRTAALSDPLTLGAAPAWSLAPVDGQKLYFLFAQDLKGQITASPLHLVVELPGGVSF